MSKIDFSRDKSGRYAIIENPTVTKYRIVEVIQRDLDNNVLRMNRNVLSEGSLEQCQKLLDKWNANADLALIQAFDNWQQNQ